MVAFSVTVLVVVSVSVFVAVIVSVGAVISVASATSVVAVDVSLEGTICEEYSLESVDGNVTVETVVTDVDAGAVMVEVIVPVVVATEVSVEVTVGTVIVVVTGTTGYFDKQKEEAGGQFPNAAAIDETEP